MATVMAMGMDMPMGLDTVTAMETPSHIGATIPMMIMERG